MPGKPLKDRLLERRRVVGDCWIYTGRLDRAGYGVIDLASGRQQQAHRAAWGAWRGPIPAGMKMLHSRECTSRACFNPEHLRPGTQAENVQDTVEWGALVRGERSTQARLNDALVLDLRRRYAAGGVTIKGLSRELAVNPQTVRRAINGEKWSHLPGAVPLRGILRGDDLPKRGPAKRL